MEYFKLLQLDREPFSNSPDPDYFFQSGQHLACLQKLELALRLKRGLNVVVGDVGTGKTTLCRQLIRKFADDPDFESHLILDPSFNTPHEFIKHLFDVLCESMDVGELQDLQMKESIKQRLFAKGVDQGKTIVLIIDEGQKISAACVEILRELLNFETNTYKLLQIVIFAQLEFEDILSAHANFTDRINLLHHLLPMNFKDTCNMVQHRLKLASATARPKKIFTLPAMWSIYRSSKGFPRQIIHLCHQSMLAMIIQNRSRAGWAIIHACRKRTGRSIGPTRRLWLSGVLAMISLVVVLGYAPDFRARKADSPTVLTARGTSPELAAVTPEQPSADTGSRAAVQARPAPADVAQASPAQPLPAATEAQAAATAAEPSSTGTHQPAATLSPALTDTDPPEVLGRLAVKPGDTMVALVQTVYGTHRNSHLRAVMEANRHIPDPNDIDIGNVISFPALPTTPGPGNRPCWWVIMGEERSLPDAVSHIQELASLAKIPLQLIATWSPQSGARFQIGIKGCYASQDEAWSASRTFPSEIAAGSNIISNWPPETIFYSIPAAGGIRHIQKTE